jgi:nicotinate-nucleotide pyrophosphorylase (carboxylating)
MHKTINRLIHQALDEDLGSGDVTTEALIDLNVKAKAVIIAKEECVLCGIDIADKVFHECDRRIEFRKNRSDGEKVAKNQILAEVTGPARVILKGERVALNFLGLLSGIATLTRQYVDQVQPYKACIVDTRKTHPGQRILEKYAVQCGGGGNHRFGLYDGILIKDTHICVVGSIGDAVRRARKNAHHLMKIEVEVETSEQIDEALEAGVDVIMLDNMDLSTMREAVKKVKESVLVEASGNISLDNVADVACCGVDLISVGELTHSAPCTDVSLKISEILS